MGKDKDCQVLGPDGTRRRESRSTLDGGSITRKHN